MPPRPRVQTVSGAVGGYGSFIEVNGWILARAAGLIFAVVCRYDTDGRIAARFDAMSLQCVRTEHKLDATSLASTRCHIPRQPDGERHHDDISCVDTKMIRKQTPSINALCPSRANISTRPRSGKRNKVTKFLFHTTLIFYLCTGLQASLAAGEQKPVTESKNKQQSSSHSKNTVHRRQRNSGISAQEERSLNRGMQRNILRSLEDQLRQRNLDR